ncbi:MAG: hypothetical protein JNM56_04990 [Planctomycetia bacterium]|nr:hypothetical protein [Planctomycetia bacterium]
MWKWLLCVLLLCGGTSLAVASGDPEARKRPRPPTAPEPQAREKTQGEWDAFFDQTARAGIVVVLIVAAGYLLVKKVKRIRE